MLIEDIKCQVIDIERECIDLEKSSQLEVNWPLLQAYLHIFLQDCHKLLDYRWNSLSWNHIEHISEDVQRQQVKVVRRIEFILALNPCD